MGPKDKPKAKAPAAKDAGKKKPAAPAAKAAEKPVAKKAEPKAAPVVVKDKALKAKKATLRGVQQTRKRKVRTSVHFRRPKTLSLPRNPKYPRKSSNSRPRLDQFKIIKFPVTTESAMKKIEDTNTLVFIVDKLCNKQHVKFAVKKLYDVDVSKVNILNRSDGEKQAYVRLAPDYDALDTANKIGII